MRWLKTKMHSKSAKDVYKRQDYINPLDINTNYSEEENPLTLKSDFILSMCELDVYKRQGISPHK